MACTGKLRGALVVHLSILHLQQSTWAYNVDTSKHINILTGPQNSLFGYSTAFHPNTNSLLIGAPTDYYYYGSVYRCNLTNLHLRNQQPCQILNVEDDSVVNSQGFYTPINSASSSIQNPESLKKIKRYNSQNEINRNFLSEIL